jgi:uncharacterized protein (TIGR03085 family)
VPEPLDARERRELCDLFEELGPDAPTLCEGWATIDLAAHLVVRERDPRSGPGLLLGGRFERMLDRLMERAKERGYQHLVEQVRNGPPLGPFAVPGLRKLINLSEYVVHHEDVRRANGLEPRTDRPELQDELWGQLRFGSRLMLRKVKGASVRLVRPDGSDIAVGKGPEAVLDGEPLDLVLYLQGRRGAAKVRLSGHPAAVEAVEAADLGI